MTNKPLLGILEPSLKKLTDFMMRTDIEVDFHIKWEYISDIGVGYAWKESIPEWET